MTQFTDLLKVLWTLWSQLSKKTARLTVQRVAVEAIARQVGRCIVEQLAEETAALMAPPTPPSPIGRNGPSGNGDASAAAQAHLLAASVLDSNGSSQAGGSTNVQDGGGQGWASIVRRAPVDPPVTTAPTSPLSAGRPESTTMEDAK